MLNTYQFLHKYSLDKCRISVKWKIGFLVGAGKPKHVESSPKFGLQIAKKMTGYEKIPASLGHLATEKLTQVLRNSVSNMNRIITSDIKKQLSSLTPPPSQENDKDGVKTSPRPVSASGPNPMTCAKAVLQMMIVRKYLMSGMSNPTTTKMTLTPKVVQQIISTAIDTNEIGVIRLLMCDWITVLDFRALDQYPSSSQEMTNWRQTPSQIPGSAQTSSKSLSPKISPTSSTPLSTYCLPPDEFDWFSRDRLGKIVTMSDCCELFSILGMSQCAPKIKELYLTARRKEYWAVPADIMEITADILLQLTGLSTLVLRGMCDDYMLKCVGQAATGLKQLDVSGSHFVTDTGLKNLFFKDVTENPATYLMKSFIEKNLKTMNPLVNSLEMLDYSFTNVTGLGRKMIYHLPQSFIFKRVFARNETYSYGHHIFLKKKCSALVKIPSENCGKAPMTKFENSLEPFVGAKGVKALLKFVEHHPWKNCSLYMYQDDDKATDSALKFYGIVTPNPEEKRIYGTVTFQDSTLIEMYSMFPVSINTLGDSCPKLQVFRGTVTDVWRAQTPLRHIWKMSSSVLSDLTILDMFADPYTTKSILESAPNLRKVRIRIVRHRLTDEYIIKPLTTFMCCRTLEELWISSGTYRSNRERSIHANLDKEDNNVVDDVGSPSFNEVRANYYAEERPPRNRAVGVTRQPQNNNAQLKQSQNSSDELDYDECEIDDLVHLTSDCIQTILKACQRLRRIGDIAWWTPVSELDLEAICNQLRKNRREVTFVWENQIFPKS